MSDVANPNLGALTGKRIDRRKLIAGASAAGLFGAAGLVGARPRRSFAQERTPVTFWTAQTEPDLLTMQDLVAQFNDSTDTNVNPGVQVELVQVPPAEVTDNTRLVTAVRGGTGPDAFYLDRFIVAQRAADGIIQDLSEYVETPLADAYLGFAAAEATYNGAPYALPFGTDARALYYNRGMIEAAGIDPSPLDAANGPATFDQVAEIAAQLNVADGNGTLTQVGFIPWLNQGWHYTYGFAWGGQFYNDAECQVTPDNPEVVAAFQWVYDYCAEQGADALSAFGTPTMQPGFAPQSHPFHLGTLAMQITGNWHVRQMGLYAPDIDYGITYIPVPNAGDPSATWSGGWSTVIPEGAQEPEAAFQFMNWLCGDAGQTYFSQQASSLPTFNVTREKTDLFADERLTFFTQDLLPTSNNRPPLPVGARYWDELTVAWQAVYLNQEEPAEALASVKERVQQELSRYC